MHHHNKKNLIITLRHSGERIVQLKMAFGLVWDAAPGWTLVWVALLIALGIIPAATVYLSGLFIDSLVLAIDDGATLETIRPTLILAGLLAATILFTELLRSIDQWIRTAQAENIQDHIKGIIHEKSTYVDLAFYESPDYFDRLHRAQNDAANQPLNLLQSVGSLAQNTITLVSMASILLRYGLWVPLALIISTLPALYVVVRYNRRYHRWWEQKTAERRWAQYYDLLLTHSGVAAEIRLFDLGALFRRAYQKKRRPLREERLRLTKSQGFAGLLAGLFAILIAGLVMFWMVWQVLLGLATLGGLTVFYQAFSRGQNLMRSTLSNVGQIYNNSLFLGNLFEFLDLEPQVVSPAEPVALPTNLYDGIRFRQVTFYYPGSKKAAIKDFDLAIPAGQIVAIVGANGAGKTTLVKLLCRFYDPLKGKIEVDGVDIRHLSTKRLRRMITVLFQFPVAYQTTAAQNIALGDLKAGLSRSEIETAARGAGAHEIITRLPLGYDTQLGKWFAGGEELSGGEWQRLALARAFLRQAPIVILDEPTSFKDSWAEADWLARFKDLVAGKTALIITHRFTTAMRADMIHVMDEGKIVESGTHAELLVIGGLYAQSWNAQMQTAQNVEVIEGNGQPQIIQKTKA